MFKPTAVLLVYTRLLPVFARTFEAIEHREEFFFTAELHLSRSIGGVHITESFYAPIPPNRTLQCFLCAQSKDLLLPMRESSAVCHLMSTRLDAPLFDKLMIL